MSNTPIAQIAVSTIKGTEKQNIYPKTIDRAVLTTDKEGNEDTLDNVLIKGIDINGETVTPDENGVVSVSIPSGGGGGTTLVAGDGATRINASALSTKQIYRGTVININGVPQGLAVGAYCFNTATKKLYVGAQHDNALVTDTVPMPDDFLFVDTASGTTYRCDGTTLNNIATNLDLRAGDGMLIEAGTFSSLGVIGGAVYTDKDAAINIPAVGTYAFNAATGKLYTAGVRMVNDNASRYLKEIVPPKVFFFYDTAEGKLYFWNGAALTQK